jgi:hypothetical protein
MLELKGIFQVQQIRDNEIIKDFTVKNGIVDVGLNHILNTEFDSGTPVTTWYIGLVDNSGTPTFNNADTLASHAGWAEAVGYTGTRPLWTAGAAAARSITNAATVDFAITAPAVIKGLFICSVTSGTVGTLWSTAAFGAIITVANADVIKITYTVSG